MKKLEEAHENLLEDKKAKNDEIAQLKLNVTSSNQALQTEKEAVEREYASLKKQVGKRLVYQNSLVLKCPKCTLFYAKNLFLRGLGKKIISNQLSVFLFKIN